MDREVEEGRGGKGTIATGDGAPGQANGGMVGADQRGCPLVAPELSVPMAGTAASYEVSGDAVLFLADFNRKHIASWRRAPRRRCRWNQTFSSIRPDTVNPGPKPRHITRVFGRMAFSSRIAFIMCGMVAEDMLPFS